MRCLLILLVTLTASSALAFEGEIDAKSIGDPSQQAEFQVYVSKAGDVRMDSSAQGRRGKAQRVSFIKPAKGQYDYMLDHAEKQAMKIPKDALARVAQDAGAPGEGEPGNFRIEKLGTAKVAGQSTRRVRLTDQDTGDTAELWLSDAYPADLWRQVFTLGGRGGPNPTKQWESVARSHEGFKPGFVMKMVAKDERGKVGGLEVTRIEEKKVAPSAFVVPTGYQVATMPSLPNMPAGKPY